MTAAVLLGAGTGLGLLLMLHGLRARRLSLAAAIAALHPTAVTAAPIPGSATGAAQRDWAARLGRPAATALRRAGLPRRSVLADLGVCDRDPDRHLGEQAVAGIAGLLLPPAVTAGLAAGGIAVSWSVPAWVSLLLAVAGLVTPDLAVRAEAQQRRTQLRGALSGLLDITVISLAGGAGVEQALRDASHTPRGWAQQRLVRAVHAATTARVPPWTTLGQLGEDTDVPALVELAAALSLAGSEGARVRATLTARAASLREHELADAEADAASATEKMSVPLVALFGGFLVFLGYPALAAVLAAL